MSRARPAAVLALVALLLFVTTALWTQVARSDLDWVRATLSLYLHGPWGLALRAAYCLLPAGAGHCGAWHCAVSRQHRAAPQCGGAAVVHCLCAGAGDGRHR